MRNFQATAEAPGGSFRVLRFSADNIEDALKELKFRLSGRPNYNPFDHYRCSLVELPNDVTHLVRYLEPAQSGQPMGETPVEDGAEEARRKFWASFPSCNVP